MAQGQPNRAVASIEPVLRAHPLADGVAIVAAQAYVACGRLNAARRLLERALKADPQRRAEREHLSRVLNLLGTRTLQDGMPILALQQYSDAVRLNPGLDDARFNLASCLLAAGQPDKALIEFERLMDADTPGVLLHRIRCHQQLRQTAQATVLLQRALHAVELDPSRAMALADLAHAMALSELGEALQARAIELGVEADEAALHRALIAVSKPSQSPSAIEDACSTLHRLRDSATAGERATSALVSHYIDSGRRGEACQVLPRNAAFNAILQAHLGVSPVITSAAEIDAVRNAIAGRAESLLDTAVQPLGALSEAAWFNFYLPYQGRNDRDLQAGWAALVQRSIKHYRPALLQPRRMHARKVLRVGLVGRWADNVVGHYFGGWARALRRHGAQAILVQSGTSDTFTQQLRANVHGYIRLDTDLDRAAQQLLDAEFDVIIYPEIGHDARLAVLAGCRLAPRQLLAWGLPTTSGLDTIDAFVSVASMEPDNANEHYAERLITLPHIGTRYPRPPAAPTLDRAAFGLPPDKRLYLFPHSPFKIHPDCDDMLCRLLHQDDSALLVMVETYNKTQWPVMRDRMQRAMQGAGVGSFEDRVIVLRPMARPYYLALHDHCDVLIDTLHFSGGNTTLDALAMGLPVVTVEGRLMRGRQSAAMLSLIGRDDLVCQDVASVLQCVQQLARAAPDRKALREQAEILFEDETAVTQLAETVVSGL